MIIRSVKLKNIRSYLEANIEFSTGTSLLAGDIGSGKSTILLAIEFAIFGIMKGILSGGSLLRHGALTGSVELHLTVDKKEVIIKRGLKRGSVGVVQESGSLTIDNSRFEGTPQELKSRILELLGYPESLLSKSKSLIFRYTVFTPQEEMKKILHESREDRLDILRRLFDIDKYKRVAESVTNYSRELKSRISFLKGKLDSLPKKEKELSSIRKESEEISAIVKAKEPEFNELKIEKDGLQSEFRKSEKDIEEMKKQENKLAIKEAELISIKKNLERNNSELLKTNSMIEGLLKELSGFDLSNADEIRKRKKVSSEELKVLQIRLSEVLTKRSEYTTRKGSSESIMRKITSLDKCPTCQQQVTPEHISEVSGRESIIIKGCENNLAKLEEFEKRFRERIASLDAALENYSKNEREIDGKIAKFSSLEEKKERKKSLEEDSEGLKGLMAEKTKSLQELRKKTAEVESKKDGFERLKTQLENKREALNELERFIAQKKAKQEVYSKMESQLDEEIKKLGLEENMLHLIEVKKNWLDSDFTLMVEQIEKNMLLRIYNDFNAFFQEWFNILIEDETISVRLDDYFSPVIEQNGYETTIESLSGGERTSVALAYRLALNKVINDFLTRIKTRELIILDEPTEGFSTEQLDRLREVLQQAKVKQTIIVSHETKMEGFVDSIIRIKKHNHESKLDC